MLYRVSQYTWDPWDYPIISAHSVYVYIYAVCLNIHGTHGTALLFLFTQYMYIYIYMQGVSIYMEPMGLPHYFCSLSICVYMQSVSTNLGNWDCPIISAHSVCKVSQYTWDPLDCLIISAHSVYVYMQGGLIYMGPMCLLITLQIIMCSF